MTNPSLAHLETMHFKDIYSLLCQSPGLHPPFVSSSQDACGIPSPTLNFFPELHFRTTCNGTEKAVAPVFEPTPTVTVHVTSVLFSEIYSSRLKFRSSESNDLNKTVNVFYMMVVFGTALFGACVVFDFKDEPYGILPLPASSGPHGSLTHIIHPLCLVASSNFRPRSARLKQLLSLDLQLFKHVQQRRRRICEEMRKQLLAAIAEKEQSTHKFTQLYVVSLIAAHMVFCDNFGPEKTDCNALNQFNLSFKCSNCKNVSERKICTGRYENIKCDNPICRSSGTVLAAYNLFARRLTAKHCKKISPAPLLLLQCRDIEPVFFIFSGMWEVELAEERKVCFTVSNVQTMDVEPSSEVFSRIHEVCWYDYVDDQPVFIIHGLKAVIARI